MIDIFSGYPKSIKEENSSTPEGWDARDALISILRDIDEGNLKVDTLVIGYYGDDDNWGYRCAAKDRRLVVSLLMHIVSIFSGE